MKYELDSDGIFTPSKSISHRNNEYDESGFDTLLNMQSRHFWYVGRHRFLLSALWRYDRQRGLSAIDLGGGVGGWLLYLHRTSGGGFTSLALGDSSRIALLKAKKILPANTKLY